MAAPLAESTQAVSLPILVVHVPKITALAPWRGPNRLAGPSERSRDEPRWRMGRRMPITRVPLAAILEQLVEPRVGDQKRADGQVIDVADQEGAAGVSRTRRTTFASGRRCAFTRGLSYRGIATRLDAEGGVPKRGSKWIHTTIEAILTS
jgi:hypothetical protein